LTVVELAKVAQLIRIHRLHFTRLESAVSRV
jgi:hypothetical protein